MLFKKGQGLSLNTIIIAALALIVLVVLVVVFTGRIGIFQEGVSREGQAELIKLKIQYGDCHPTATEEAGFTTRFNDAESVGAQELEEASFKDEIDRCDEFTDADSCTAATCKWR